MSQEGVSELVLEVERRREQGVSVGAGIGRGSLGGVRLGVVSRSCIRQHGEAVLLDCVCLEGGGARGLCVSVVRVSGWCLGVAAGSKWDMREYQL